MKSRLALVAFCCFALAACGTMGRLWPFGKKVKPGPDVVNEVSLVTPEGAPAAYPQYWQRNTLVIDLSGVSGAGAVTARLPEDTAWPVRMAVRVQPGSVQQLEIQGEERNVLPVAAEGAKPIDIEIGASLYTPRTAAIYLSWGPMPVFAEAPVAPADPGFVSPTERPQPAAEQAPPAGASEIIPPGTVPQVSPGS